MILGFIAVQLLRDSRAYRFFYNNTFSSDPDFYKRIGTDYVRNLIRFSPLKYFNQRIHLSRKKADKNELLKLKREMTDAEFGHVIGFISVWIVVGFFYYFGVKIIVVFILSFLNIVFNLYPVFIQQANKLRVNKLLSRVL